VSVSEDAGGQLVAKIWASIGARRMRRITPRYTSQPTPNRRQFLWTPDFRLVQNP
jgi:hypothetical protein